MPIVTRRVEIDALDLLEKPVDEMLPRLLAIGDDVDARHPPAASAISSVASRLASASASPSTRHGAQSICGSASQDGFGRLPAIVVSSIPHPFWLP